MKTLALVFVFFFGFVSAQMPNIEQVWLNDSKPYSGEILVAGKAVPLKVHISISEQNKKNDQEYYVSGNTLFDEEVSRIEGSLDIKKYKDKKKGGSVFGEYEIAEEPQGKHSGIYKGKFVFKFKWNSKTEQIEDKEIDFSGTWTSYDGKTHYKTQWKNE